MLRVASLLPVAAAAVFASFLAGCGGTSASATGCGAHQYSYVGGGIAYSGGTGWYGGSYGGGWYDPGDDGTDYAYESASASGDGSGGSSGDNGSYGDGSGDDGSGDNGSADDGSDNSSDDGSGDDGSGDDGSGDDGTASKKHLHTTSVPLHTASAGAPAANACYAYSCDLLCAVGSPATTEREALGYSAISASDACETAAHGVETWAHDSYGENVSACRLAGDDVPSSPSTPTPRTPATPSVRGGFSSTPSTGSGASKSANLPTIR
jgi:hypothetical protein